MQHRTGRTVCLVFVALVAFSVPCRSDLVTLDDGRKIEGLVISQSPIEVAIKLDTGAVVRFPRNRVRSITTADWKYYVAKGDSASDPTEALEYYKKAKTLNPSAPDLDAKIKAAQQKLALEERKKALERERKLRQAEETKVLERYRRFIEAVQPDAARDYLEEEIKKKPWLCEPRIKLAEFYTRDRTVKGRTRYVEILAGLVRNDPETYYALYAPRVVEAAENILTDATVSASMDFATKDHLASLVTPFVGEGGKLVPLENFEKHLAALKSSPTTLTLAKIEFLKNVCLKRPENQPCVEPELLSFLNYGKTLDTPQGRKALQAKLKQWVEEARTAIEKGEIQKGAALAEVILAFEPKSTEARRLAVAARVAQARKSLKRNRLDEARRSIEAAEKIVPNDPQIADAKAALYLEQAKNFMAAGDLANAAEALRVASQARARDKQIADAVKTQQELLFGKLMGLARASAKQKNYAAAIEFVRLARRAKPSFMTKIQTNPILTEYERKLHDALWVQIFTAAQKDDYAAIAAARAVAQRYGILTMVFTKGGTSLNDDVTTIVAMARKKAKALKDKNDSYGLFQLLGRLQPLYSDSEMQDLLNKARSEVVEGGKLPPQFFQGTWLGQGVKWVLAENSVSFDGAGRHIASDNLPPNAFQLEHTGGPGYVIRINRYVGQDSYTVRVVGPDAIVLENCSLVTQNSSNPDFIPLNVTLRRVREETASSPPSGAGSTGGGGGRQAPSSPDQES